MPVVKYDFICILSIGKRLCFNKSRQPTDDHCNDDVDEIDDDDNKNDDSR